ncbi:hypothetical protein E2C01_046329 [Portunus trituberculatus]|uniref:Uncharacterized protein n=1 Tax=Portunus trituberculatus TaxID=210409 RepID=A0A5B7FXK8_PORTR|nr:hypothetical protein [Portunus trituberculatus]
MMRKTVFRTEEMTNMTPRTRATATPATHDATPSPSTATITTSAPPPRRLLARCLSLPALLDPLGSRGSGVPYFSLRYRDPGCPPSLTASRPPAAAYLRQAPRPWRGEHAECGRCLLHGTARHAELPRYTGALLGPVQGSASGQRVTPECHHLTRPSNCSLCRPQGMASPHALTPPH